MTQALTPNCPFCAADALDIPRTPFDSDETPSDYLCEKHLKESKPLTFKERAAAIYTPAFLNPWDM